METVLLSLAEFFSREGLLDKLEYKQNKQVPYRLREVERMFNNYAEMLYKVRQYKLPPVIRNRNKKPIRRQKRVKEDSLDE